MRTPPEISLPNVPYPVDLSKNRFSFFCVRVKDQLPLTSIMVSSRAFRLWCNLALWLNRLDSVSCLQLPYLSAGGKWVHDLSSSYAHGATSSKICRSLSVQVRLGIRTFLQRTREYLRSIFKRGQCIMLHKVAPWGLKTWSGGQQVNTYFKSSSRVSAVLAPSQLPWKRDHGGVLNEG